MHNETVTFASEKLIDWGTADRVGRRVAGFGQRLSAVERARLFEDFSELVPEAEAMVQRAAKTAEATSAEILAEAKASAEQITTRAREEISAEKDRALAEIRGEVADLALEAAGKLIGAEMDAPTQRRLVKQFLSENRN